MKYIEYGKENENVLILLHGGGLSWWNYREVAELLYTRFHIILPILDGHSGSDESFTTIEDNAQKIIEFIDEYHRGKVLLIGGLSLGGQILLEILSQRNDICEYAIIESALVIPSKIICSMIKPAFGSCYGLIKLKWFSKLQFKSLRIKKELFNDYYIDTCNITKQNMISFLQANSMYSLKDSILESNAKIHIYIGSKENRLIKKSGTIIHSKLKDSKYHILKKLHHGEFSINNPSEYANEILEIIKC